MSTQEECNNDTIPDKDFGSEVSDSEEELIPLTLDSIRKSPKDTPNDPPQNNIDTSPGIDNTPTIEEIGIVLFNNVIDDTEQSQKAPKKQNALVEPEINCNKSSQDHQTPDKPKNYKSSLQTIKVKNTPLRELLGKNMSRVGLSSKRKVEPLHNNLKKRKV